MFKELEDFIHELVCQEREAVGETAWNSLFDASREHSIFQPTVFSTDLKLPTSDLTFVILFLFTLGEEANSFFRQAQ
jgi:hypothetical protein